MDNMGARVTTDIQDEWNKVFGHEDKEKIGNQEIKIDYGAEKGAEGSHKYYIRFLVKEGAHTYSVQERSLGFKWFFAFFIYDLSGKVGTFKNYLSI